MASAKRSTPFLCWNCDRSMRATIHATGTERLTVTFTCEPCGLTIVGVPHTFQEPKQVPSPDYIGRSPWTFIPLHKHLSAVLFSDDTVALASPIDKAVTVEDFNLAPTVTDKPSVLESTCCGRY